MKKIFWIVNYTEQANKGRTAFCELFGLRRDAVAFARGKHGYILRAEGDKRTFDHYFGGFIPTAQEGRQIESLVGYIPEAKTINKLELAYLKATGK